MGCSEECEGLVLGLVHGLVATEDSGLPCCMLMLYRSSRFGIRGRVYPMLAAVLVMVYRLDNEWLLHLRTDRDRYFR